VKSVKERRINSAKTGEDAVVADFSLRQKQRGLKSAKTEVNNAVADFSLRPERARNKFR